MEGVVKFSGRIVEMFSQKAVLAFCIDIPSKKLPISWKFFFLYWGY
ncbi:hypothetical protein HBHAL_2526 [Halobacillus halophilus DSM 2266]|uniref:Uncharacterized protein n=1 Tax=Halobacillus halophilus (strain ATCC 35676 / DSM 2266 / JCM 20832 / KCTC 3685 / LMG 17431 / NBRC 102448 / NCIMB 2269) TaxID=866895 RepID=I0JL51_HALH3|nr:hypothetical protein HBHAL_2526 [Halobacillus halophilus DSM 2266]